MPPLPVVPPAGSDAGQQQQGQQQQQQQQRGHSISHQVADFNEVRQSPAAALEVRQSPASALSGSSRNGPRQQTQQQRAQGLGIRNSTTTVRPAPGGYPFEDGFRSSATPVGLSRRRSGDSISNGEPLRDDNENSRPAGRAANSVAADTRGAARSVGPEVDEWPPETRPAGSATVAVAPLTNNQQHQARGIHSNNEPAEWHARGGRGEEERPVDGVEMEMWKLGLQVGSKLDVKDTVDKWCEASVIAVEREAGRVLVTYTYWAPKFDEWIDIDSPSLALPNTKTYQEGGPLRVGHRVEALDETNSWLEADVVEESPDGRARVHFKRFHEKFDKWIWPCGGEVRQFGPYRVVPKGNRSARRASLAPGQPHVRQIAQLSIRYDHYSRALESKGLRVVTVEGDGNCLFRSVSHQIYGDDGYHRLVRARCMDYMESEANFFEPYVEGDMAAFLRYLDVKRRNAVWGDDPEVQALCEIYDRPAEIWAYDLQLGAKTLRSFHEAAGTASAQDGPRRPPMRLSYYGGGHYDSVSVIGDPVRAADTEGGLSPRVMQGSGAGVEDSGASGVGAGTAEVAVEPILEPGRLEEDALERSRRRATEGCGGRLDREEMKMRREDESSSEQSTRDHTLAWSRNFFDAQFDDLDSALVASVDHMEQSNLTSLEAASRDSELVVLQEEMLRSAQAQSEEEQLRNALEASCNTAAAAAEEADMVQQAIAESIAAAGGEAVKGAAGEGGALASSASSSAAGHGQRADGVVMDNEEEELKRAIALSGMGDGAWAVTPGGAGAGQGLDLDELGEDSELRRAIKASLAGE